MNVLIGFERSQRVAFEFRMLGHNVWSCDLKKGDQGLPHIQGNVFDYLGKNQYNQFYGWDLAILFPPCTHLASSGAKHFQEKRADGRQQQAITQFMACVSAPIDKIAIENPIGVMSTVYRKPDQIVQPYYFGDSYKKSTCLWLKGLPLLQKTDEVNAGEFVITSGGKKLPKWYSNNKKMRDLTFPGLARAMAAQWGKLAYTQLEIFSKD